MPFQTLGSKGSNIGEAHAGLYKTVRTLFKEDLLAIVIFFFDIEQFKTKTKMLIHF
jgi:hypothetical protein